MDCPNRRIMPTAYEACPTVILIPIPILLVTATSSRRTSPGRPQELPAVTDYPTQPEAIAAGSFGIIRQELVAAGYDFQPPLAGVIERMIHSTAEF